MQKEPEAASSVHVASEDDPMCASSPHERMDLSVDSRDEAYNNFSDMDESLAVSRSGYRRLKIVEADISSPPRGSTVDLNAATPAAQPVLTTSDTFSECLCIFFL